MKLSEISQECYVISQECCDECYATKLGELYAGTMSIPHT